jgi:hypothetical protein
MIVIVTAYLVFPVTWQNNTSNKNSTAYSYIISILLFTIIESFDLFIYPIKKSLGQKHIFSNIRNTQVHSWGLKLSLFVLRHKQRGVTAVI